MEVTIIPICRNCGTYYMESNFVKGCPNCAIQEEQSRVIDDLQGKLNACKDKLHQAKTELELEK